MKLIIINNQNYNKRNKKTLILESVWYPRSCLRNLKANASHSRMIQRKKLKEKSIKKKKGKNKRKQSTQKDAVICEPVVVACVLLLKLVLNITIVGKSKSNGDHDLVNSHCIFILLWTVRNTKKIFIGQELISHAFSICSGLARTVAIKYDRLI